MSIKYASYLHQKSANYAKYSAFIFLVLKLHIKCVPNSTFGRCSCALTFLNYVAKFEPNLILICPK